MRSGLPDRGSPTAQDVAPAVQATATSMRLISAMTGRLPLRFADRNLLYSAHAEDVAALYRLPEVSYPFLRAGDKLRELRRYARLAAALEADVSVWRVSRTLSTADYGTDVEPLGYPGYRDPIAWRRLLEDHESHLRRLSAHSPEVYMAASLRESRAARLGASVVASADRLRRRVEGVLDVDSDRPVLQRELERHRDAEQRIAMRIAAICPEARRATTEELQWLFRRAACRGVGEPVLDAGWRSDEGLRFGADGREASYRPERGVFLRLAPAAIYEEGRQLVVDADECRTYQAMFVLGGLPEAPWFPGPLAELLHAPLAALGFPVDAVIHLRHIPNQDARAQVKRKVMDADNVAAEERLGRHGVSWSSEDRQSLARQLDDELSVDGRPPLLRATISLALGASTREELEERVDALRDRYHPVVLHRPLGLQPILYEEHLPRVGSRLLDGGYSEILTIEQFGALMPTAGNRVGSDRGPYVGCTTVAETRPVCFHPFEAARHHRPPSILAAGSLGSGKTLFAMLLAYLAQRMGAMVVTVDPKPDHSLHAVAGLDGLVDVVDVTAGEETRGLLDPLRIAPPTLREDLALSYFTAILRNPSDAWELEIQRAVQQVLQRGESSSLAVLEALEHSPNDDARRAGEALRTRGNSALGALAFGDSKLGVGATRAPITTIRTSGLQLPGPRTPREDMTHAERMSLATLSLVASYALRLVETSRGERGKLVVIDEAWSLLASTEGKALINRINRMGRAMDATLVLATQTLGDVGDLEKLVGTRVVFGLETREEAAAALELLGLDRDDEATIDRIRAYSAGQCLMRDVNGRVGELQIDLVFQRLVDALDTSPAGQGSRAEVRGDETPEERPELDGIPAS